VLPRSRGSSVDVVTGYGLHGRVLIPGSGKIFFSPLHPDRLRGTPCLVSSVYGALFPTGVKRPGREADNSPPSSAEVKNVGAPPPCMSSRHWDNSTFQVFPG
jgi:hypothetical protein